MIDDHRKFLNTEPKNRAEMNSSSSNLLKALCFLENNKAAFEQFAIYGIP